MLMSDSYELQLDESIRKLGFGKILMDEMERIGRTRRMDKAMLTCYKSQYIPLHDTFFFVLRLYPIIGLR